MGLFRVLRDCGFLLKPAIQKTLCLAIAAGTMTTSKIEEEGFCLDSDDEALDEEIIRAEEVEALKVGVSRASERADVAKAVKLLKRIAKAWLWNNKDDLQACIRSCRGVKLSKHVLVSSGIYSFMIYRDGSLAMIVGKDYAKSLDSLTYKWKKVIRDDGSVVKTGEPLGGQFATYPRTSSEGVRT